MFALTVEPQIEHALADANAESATNFRRVDGNRCALELHFEGAIGSGDDVDRVLAIAVCEGDVITHAFSLVE